MTRFRLTRAAGRDLEDITDHVARDSVEAAARVLDRLERAFLELAERPGLGHRREDLTPEDFRFWPVHDYLVVHDPRTSPLTIVRVLHGRRDVSGELDPESSRRRGEPGDPGPGEVVREVDEVVPRAEVGKVHGPEGAFGHHLPRRSPGPGGDFLGEAAGAASPTARRRPARSRARSPGRPSCSS